MTKATVIEKNKNDIIVLEIENGYSATLLELPDGYAPENFFKATEEIEISKPYTGEHSCPHAQSSKFDKFRSADRESGVKCYRVLYGRVKESNRWEVASFRYPKATWDTEEARKHCKACHGLAFEKAVVRAEDCENEQTKDGMSFEVKKTDKFRKLVYGIFLESGVVDTQKDIESSAEIEKAAHRYMIRLWQSEKPDMIGAEHSYSIPRAVIVESFIAPIDFWYPESPQDAEHLVKAGSWVVAALIENDDEFAKVLSGDYTGFSIQGDGKRRSV